MAEERLDAIAVSRGVAIGPVIFLRDINAQIGPANIDPSAVAAEVERFRGAVKRAKVGLHSIAKTASAESSGTVTDVLGVHLLILESSFIDNIELKITEQRISARSATRLVAALYGERQETVADERMREKRVEISDVATRLLVELGEPDSAETDITGSVIVAREIGPSTVIELAKHQPGAIVTERGGWTSHASILAREFGIPMVSGVRIDASGVAQGESIVVDGDQGEVVIHPSAESVSRAVRVAGERRASHDISNSAMPAMTVDGTEIHIRANFEMSDVIGFQKPIAAQGIGLSRSESLIHKGGKLPDEDEQTLAYKRIAELAMGEIVNIRTFDIGPAALAADKPTPEPNPSLGLRSIRLSLVNSDMFRTQIRAILRANTSKNIGVVLPMISGVSEVRLAREMIAEEQRSLAAKGVVTYLPRLGAMIEVPSAVFTAVEISRSVDFLCLGTNDLVQYLLAVDRDNDLVADWYQTLHPAVMRAIRFVAKACDESEIPLIACGEMSGSPFYVPLLIGLGIRELSMSMNSIAQIEKLIAGITVAETNQLAESTAKCETPDAVEKLLRDHYTSNWSGLFPAGFLSSKHH